ncbi:MAG TPA: hypothetical protein VKF15_07895 [Nitrososphaerales archaeon]|nr:hypothetical protein [Nitrososphaerales archaeon]
MKPSDDWGKVRMLVVLFLVLQLVSTVLVWSLNPVGPRAESEFALLLAADLVAFSVVSHIAMAGNRGERIRGGFVLGGSAAALLLMFLVLIV